MNCKNNTTIETQTRYLQILSAVCLSTLLITAAFATTSKRLQDGMSAFCSIEKGHNDIFTTNSDGTKVTSLTKTSDQDEIAPSFSTDGTKLAYPYKLDEQNSVIGIMDAVCGGTPTATASNTPTPGGTPSISGTVTYGNTIGPPMPHFVSNVRITCSGSPTVMTTTAAPGAGAGQYNLTGFGSGSYTMTLSKTGGVNDITSFDAAKVAQHVAGTSPLTGNQLLAADVSDNGAISSFDAAEIANFVVSGSSIGTTGDWKFIPANRMYGSVTSNVCGGDYSALLMGEVSGNWSNNVARPSDAVEPEKGISVEAARLVAPTDDTVVVPISVKGLTDKEVISYEFVLRYDPTVILPQAYPIDLTETVSRSLVAKVNSHERGLLKVAVYGPSPINADGLLVNLRFISIGAAGWVSPLAFERIMFNEGEPGVLATDGQIELSASTAHRSELTGRVISAMGQSVSNAQVTLIDVMGLKRSTISNGFGGYRFGNLQVGQTYTIDATARELKFAPLAISVTDQITNVDIVAE